MTDDTYLPTTIPWKHPLYVNTCTSDNFLTILLLHCQQNPSFLDQLGKSSAECALKAGINDMLNGNIIGGKTTVLRYISSVIKDKQNKKGKIDCYGSEYSRFLHAFRHVWKLQLKLECDSLYCPIASTQRQQTTYSLNSRIPFEEQIREHFPYSGERMQGYCGAHFHQRPPVNAPSAITDRQDRENPQKRITFYECRGKHIVQSSYFKSKSVWVLPFDISNIKPCEFNIMTDISVYGTTYKLARYSIHQQNHFTSVVYWKGKQYYYDGMKDKQLVPFNDRRHLKRSMGSYAYFLQSDSCSAKQGFYGCIYGLSYE